MKSNQLSIVLSSYISKHIENVSYLSENSLSTILAASEAIVRCINNGGKLMICGNGGSAAASQHLAAEFLVRLTHDVNREGIPAISLLQDSSTFTAAINDFDHVNLFRRNLETLAKPEDVLLVLSTSGNSKNIVQVLKTAKKINIKAVGFLGSEGGKCLNYCDLAFVVPSNKTARIQEVHIMVGHALIEYVETRLLEEGFLNLS